MILKVMFLRAGRARGYSAVYETTGKRNRPSGSRPGRPPDQTCASTLTSTCLRRNSIILGSDPAPRPGRKDVGGVYPAVSPPANILAHLRCAGKWTATPQRGNVGPMGEAPVSRQYVGGESPLQTRSSQPVWLRVMGRREQFRRPSVDRGTHRLGIEPRKGRNRSAESLP